MSMYLITSRHDLDPALAITQNSTEDAWMNRYTRYVPGYKWVDSTTWRLTPSMLIEDLNVNSLVQPGDVFLQGEIEDDGHVTEDEGYTADGDWPIPAKLDVQFNNTFSTVNDIWSFCPQRK